MNLKIKICIVAIAAMPSGVFAGDYSICPPGITDVTVKDGFWKSRLETNRVVTLRTDFAKCEEARIPNFTNAAARAWGTFRGIPYDDSDVYKVIEGAAYVLATHPDAELEKYVDGVNAAIVGAQEPDGYIYTARTLGFTTKDKDGKIGFGRMGPTRWSYLTKSHEFYNVGHLYEAAVAYWKATGKRTLLDAAIKSADLIDRTFGPTSSQLKDTSGHEEIELALCKLYRATGETRYLKLAEFLLDMRGRDCLGRNSSASVLSGELVQGDEMDMPGADIQMHLPVVRQREAVGHAVRATYLYCGMADVAALSGKAEYLHAIDAIWENVVTKKLHLNGSVGARRRGEAFGANYELPNETAYLETCAGIGNALWNWRMFLLHGDAKYIDVIERALYNGIASGVSLSGDEFFYPNPLASKGGYKRSKWFRTSCCPVNIARFIPQIPQFAYATDGDSACVNLFMESEATLKLKSGEVKLVQKTDYPWNGNVSIAVMPSPNLQTSKALNFQLAIRIPGWCVGHPVPSDLYAQVVSGTLADFAVKVNGKAFKIDPVKGYCVINREWQKGDVVEVAMNMPVRRIKAHELVEADRGRLAVERGPIVYCAEGADNDGKAFDAIIPADATFADGIVEIGGHSFPSLKSSNGVTLIPYCLWDNRKPGNEMQTWFATDAWAGTDMAVSYSHCNPRDGTDGLFKGTTPSSSTDRSIRRFTFWPHCGSEEWIQCDFRSPRAVRGVRVYWFDDTSTGGRCALPKSWSIEWRASDSSPWMRIDAACPISRDSFCEMEFPEEVAAKAIRMNVRLRDGFSCGILTLGFVGVDVRSSSAVVDVGTYNIRTGNADSGTPNAWDARKSDVAAMIRKMDLDAFGLQEVDPGQAEFLNKELPEYGMLGEYRNADRRSGEASPVFYRKDRFVVEKSGTFWLSETPDVPGKKGWGAAFPRVCTWALLRDRRSGKSLVFANTHTDHKSELARKEGMLLIIRRMREFAPAGTPIVFTGDHNCRETEAPAVAVSEILTNALYVSKTTPEGPWRTLNLWKWQDREFPVADALKLPQADRNAGTVCGGRRIDYIYVSKGVEVLEHKTHADPRPGTKLYPSDHFPVTARIILPD